MLLVETLRYVDVVKESASCVMISLSRDNDLCIMVWSLSVESQRHAGSITYTWVCEFCSALWLLLEVRWFLFDCRVSRVTTVYYH